MIKDLTTLKWKKNIYYVSENVIFDIEQRKKKFDIDCCGTYLIDTSLEKINKAMDGSTLDIKDNPEVFINNVPYIVAEFIKDEEQPIRRYFPLQYLIEEGDKVVEDKVVLYHPNVFDNEYINKFNLDVFDYIVGLLKGKELFESKNILTILNNLPDWLTIDESKPMTEKYIDKYFLKGLHYYENLATKGSEVYTFKSIKLGIGTALYPINIWNKETIERALTAIYAERIINKYGNSTNLSISSMEDMAESIKDVKTCSHKHSLTTLLNIRYNEGSLESINFESLCAEDDIDTYYEYLKSKDTKRFFSMINNSDTYNSNYVDGTGLWKYYLWSDVANKPYKEDLWNVAQNRAANLNDAKKDSETGEFLLDLNGNYIYEGCERCWKGAVNAPGAKFPWIVVNFNTDVNSTITFKYTYPDGTIKKVNPWGDKIFGGEKTWGVASVATEFEDNDFLIKENRKDGGQSTFDINRFELILNPVDE